MAADTGAAKIIALKGRRLSALTARLSEPGWRELAQKAIDYLGTDQWYRDHPHAIRFDVLVRPGKVEEYVERSAVTRTTTNGSPHRATVDQAFVDDLKANPALGRGHARHGSENVF